MLSLVWCVSGSQLRCGIAWGDDWGFDTLNGSYIPNLLAIEIPIVADNTQKRYSILMQILITTKLIHVPIFFFLFSISPLVGSANIGSVQGALDRLIKGPSH